MRKIAILLLAASGLAAHADTIYLKNGRKIVADSVKEQNDKLEYEIGEDTYRIPKTMVDHVDASGVPSRSSSPSQSTDKGPAPEVSSQLTFRGAEEIVAKVLNGGHVNMNALHEYESSGNSDAAAAAYFIAGRYEFDHGDREQARRYYERALGYAPDQPLILVNYASVLSILGRPREAIPYAERAVRGAPNLPDALIILGYAYFASDRTEDAIRVLEKAQELRPDARVESLLAKAKRETANEASFSEKDNGRFTLRYEGGQSKPEFREQLLSVLDRDYDDLSNELGIAPYQNIAVTLYTQQAFFDVTQAPAWTGALNDGKLRIPLRGVDTITPQLARVLKHELAHSFVNQASARRCPQWLNEGIAQLVEPRSASAHGRRLAQQYGAGMEIPLNGLEGNWMRFSSPEAALAYDESLAAVEYIRDTYGMSEVRRLLERLANGSSVESALKESLHADYGQLEEELKRYLTDKYGS